MGSGGRACAGDGKGGGASSLAVRIDALAVVDLSRASSRCFSFLDPRQKKGGANSRSGSVSVQRRGFSLFSLFVFWVYIHIFIGGGGLSFFL